MSTTELKEKLIAQIKKTDNINLLEEAYRLLGIELEDNEVYKMTDIQKSVVNEAREQIRKGQFMTNEESDEDIDKWLNK